MMLEVVNKVEFEVVEGNDTFLVSNKEVAQVFGVGESALRQHKSRSEFSEGKHWVSQVVTSELENGKQNVQTKTMWTKRGIIRLGFKLQETEFTIAFRDWAEDYIINGGEVVAPMTNEQIMANAMVIAQNTLSDMTNKVEALHGANNLLVDRNQRLFETVEAKEEEIQTQKDINEHISDRSEAITIGEWAKMMFDLHSTTIGQNRLFRVLRDLGYLKRDNTPMQNYIEQRLFVVKESSYNHPHTAEKIFNTKTLVTYKGIDRITNSVIVFLEDE